MKLFDSSEKYSPDVLAAAALIDVSHRETDQELGEYLESEEDQVDESLAGLIKNTIADPEKDMVGPLVDQMPRSENDRENYEAEK